MSVRELGPTDEIDYWSERSAAAEAEATRLREQLALTATKLGQVEAERDNLLDADRWAFEARNRLGGVEAENMTLRTELAAAGVENERLRRVLDFACRRLDLVIHPLAPGIAEDIRAALNRTEGGN